MVFVAISLVALLGFTAFALDFGRMYIERRQLQSGADAAALAIAAECASGDCGDPMADAELYADANAADGASRVRDLVVDPFEQTVHVDTAAETAGGGHGLDMLLAPVIGFDEATVGAQATVAWGPPGALTTVPIIFSQCEWQAFGDSAVSVQTLPPVTNGFAAAGTPHTIYFHGDHDCHESTSGSDLPGGFGWLDADNQCQTHASVGGWVGVDPGNSPSNGCVPDDLRSLLGSVVLLPYFDETAGSGNNGEYHIEGFGALYLTGYYFSGGRWREESIVDGHHACSGPDRCLQGYILHDYVITEGEPGSGGADRGVSVVKLVD